MSSASRASFSFSSSDSRSAISRAWTKNSYFPTWGEMKNRLGDSITFITAPFRPDLSMLCSLIDTFECPGKIRNFILFCFNLMYIRLYQSVCEYVWVMRTAGRYPGTPWSDLPHGHLAPTESLRTADEAAETKFWCKALHSVSDLMQTSAGQSNKHAQQVQSRSDVVFCWSCCPAKSAQQSSSSNALHLLRPFARLNVSNVRPISRCATAIFKWPPSSRSLPAIHSPLPSREQGDKRH